ncbi:unnamed protein product [Cuscuta europaea]|uniref:RNase H type-1 domain-containing protein n=1 Tax=Cuscuta europaea TaxID=41803 RepID=A0A9P0ZBX6_CUSEU|nr:unnamed protein product [Cuscuta europaea]
MSWWLKAGAKKMEDIFKHCLPGIICWHIWKTYSSLIWGQEGFTPSSAGINKQIKIYSQTWSVGLPKGKIRTVERILYEEEIIPSTFRLGRPIILAVKWKKPSQTFKLNTDARYSPESSAGGAILRDTNGTLVCAISFPLQASSSLVAEIQAALQSVCWMIEEGYSDFEMEGDSTEAVKIIREKGCGRWSYEVKALMMLSEDKKISYFSVWREANWVAHFLADHASAQFQKFSEPNQLPARAKNAYLMDLFGIPSLRIMY